MATLESRILEKRRKYDGEDAAESLVNWLNFTRDEAAKARILNVISTFRGLAFCVANMPRDLIYEKDGDFYERQTVDTARRDDLKQALAHLLSYYQAVPSIITIPRQAAIGEVSCMVSWKPAPGSRFSSDQQTLIPSRDTEWRDEFDLPGGQMAEIGALLNVLDLIRAATILKVASCRCRQFYFRKFAHQRFCSTKCRLADFRDSDESRAKRNDYARKLYHLRKTGKVK
jgi:hypothetical protein